MLTIIIALAVSFGLMWLTFNTVEKEVVFTILGTCALAIFLFFIPFGLFSTVSGYKEPELIKEIELVTLSNSTASVSKGTCLYVEVSANNVYSYRYEVPNTSGVEGNMYEVATVSENVKEVETNTDKAVLRIYESKGKMSVWTFAIGRDKVSYVFIVPKGSISHSVALN